MSQGLELVLAIFALTRFVFSPLRRKHIKLRRQYISGTASTLYPSECTETAPPERKVKVHGRLYVDPVTHSQYIISSTCRVLSLTRAAVHAGPSIKPVFVYTDSCDVLIPFIKQVVHAQHLIPSWFIYILLPRWPRG